MRRAHPGARVRCARVGAAPGAAVRLRDASKLRATEAAAESTVASGDIATEHRCATAGADLAHIREVRCARTAQRSGNRAPRGETSPLLGRAAAVSHGVVYRNQDLVDGNLLVGVEVPLAGGIALGDRGRCCKRKRRHGRDCHEKTAVVHVKALSTFLVSSSQVPKRSYHGEGETEREVCFEG